MWDVRVDFSRYPVLCGRLTFILFVCVDVFPGLIDLVRVGHTYFAAGRKIHYYYYFYILYYYDYTYYSTMYDY